MTEVAAVQQPDKSTLGVLARPAWVKLTKTPPMFIVPVLVREPKFG
jgi:hypothetical protein